MGDQVRRRWSRKAPDVVAKDLGGENGGGILSEGQDALEMFKRAVYPSVTYTS